MKDIIKQIIIVIFGSFILAIGVNFFLIPFRILDGGIIGIALTINYLTGLKVGLTVILFSLPIYLFSWIYYPSFFYNSIFGMFISSFLIDLLYPYQFYFTYYVRLTPLFSAIIGGALVGFGIGFLLRFNTSIGGADMLAQIIANLLHINVGIMIFAVDSIVITVGGILISLETFRLSVITIISVALTTSIITLNHKFCENCDKNVGY